MQYTYGLAAALLMGGSVLTIATGQPVSAQVAQNDDSRIHPGIHNGAPGGFAELTEQLAPAVVNISTRQSVQIPTFNPFHGTPFEDFFGTPRGEPQTREAQSLGSGFIISADGYVVTNNHVIQPPGQSSEVEEITVTMPDGSEYPATLVGNDPASDLAVLKISGDTPFPFVEFGDSGNVRVGDWVIAIGNPFGLGGTVTSGIVSSVYRNIGLGSPYGRYIQTDASINRGNSGGPMFNMQGQVIGINNAIFSPNGGSVGIGFAIPAEIAIPIVEKLKEGENIERGYLGVRIQPLTDDLADSLGLARNRGEFVQSVEPQGSADKAGIEPGDVIVEVDGKEVTRTESLSYLIASAEPGNRVSVELIRNGKRMEVGVTLGVRPTQEELAQQSFYPDGSPGSDAFGDSPDRNEDALVEKALGLSIQPLTLQIARQLGVSDVEGLVINAVNPNSDAARKGLRRGDIILSANYRQTNSAEALEEAINTAKDEDRDALLLRVQRRGRPATYIPVRLQQDPS